MKILHEINKIGICFIFMTIIEMFGKNGALVQPNFFIFTDKYSHLILETQSVLEIVENIQQNSTLYC